VDEQWARMTLEEHCQWIHRMGAKMMYALADRVWNQDKVMQGRGETNHRYA
jgi:hypothetical protein